MSSKHDTIFSRLRTPVDGDDVGNVGALSAHRVVVADARQRVTSSWASCPVTNQGADAVGIRNRCGDLQKLTLLRKSKQRETKHG